MEQPVPIAEAKQENGVDPYKPIHLHLQVLRVCAPWRGVGGGESKAGWGREEVGESDPVRAPRESHPGGSGLWQNLNLKLLRLKYLGSFPASSSYPRAKFSWVTKDHKIQFSAQNAKTTCHLRSSSLKNSRFCPLRVPHWIYLMLVIPGFSNAL